MPEQLRIIAGGMDIAICTPGRVRDMVQQRKVMLNEIRFFVLDEAVCLFLVSFLHFQFLG